MAEALYRKYRPTTFKDVAEQKHVVQTISNQLATGKVAHAYLFAGPRGVGKTTIARLLAKALNCENRAEGSAEPCNVCGTCLDAQAGRFLDTVEIDAASQTKVEETRENIIENVRFAPSRGKFKVFIIDEVHMLSTSSFNALLKTLEEPPAHVVFILATTELHKIPATIISRCQRFDFHRIPAKEMIERLEGIAKSEGFEIDQPVFANIARLSEGCLRDAESLLGQVLALGEKHITEELASLIIPATYTGTVLELAAALGAKQTPAVLEVINLFAEEGGSIKHLVDELIEFTRSMLFAALGSQASEAYDAETSTKLVSVAKQLGASELERLLDALLSARGRQAPSQYPQLPLELAVTRFCLGESIVSTPEPAKSITPPAVPKAAPVAALPARVELPPLRAAAPIAPKPVAPSSPVAQNPDAQVAATEADVVELKDKWKRCVSLVGETNMTLPLVLNNAEVLRVENGQLIIGFPYGMHVDKVTEVKNLRVIEDAVAQILMRRLKLTFIHNKANADEAVSDLLEAFGGAVV